MELATTDHAAAEKFYSELFAWSFSEFPIGPDELYTMFKVAGRDVAAAYALRAEQLKQGIMPPMPIEDIESIAVLADPQGALFAIFEPSHQK